MGLSTDDYFVYLIYVSACRQRENLYKHWRTQCKEIQKSIHIIVEPNANGELSMDDAQLFDTVGALFRHKALRFQQQPPPESQAADAQGLAGACPHVYFYLIIIRHLYHFLL